MKKILIILTIAMIVTHTSFMCGRAEAQRGRKAEKLPKAELKNPTTAASMSLLPGGGQFYNGDISKGVLFAGGGLVSLLCILHTETEKYHEPDTTIFPGEWREEKNHPLLGVGILGFLTVIGGGAADAYFSAIKKNRELAEKYKIKTGLYMDKFELKLSYSF